MARRGTRRIAAQATRERRWINNVDFIVRAPRSVRLEPLHSVDDDVLRARGISIESFRVRSLDAAEHLAAGWSGEDADRESDQQPGHD